MPIPTPQKGEDQKVFIKRCLSDDIINAEYEDNSKRVAICYSQWRKKNKDTLDESVHNRSFKINLDLNNNKNSFRIDKSTGFLYVDAVLTRSGVFDYYDETGNLLREYRSDNEVFNKKSLDSLKLKPITNKHSGGMVTVDNVKDFQLGSVGDNIIKDSDLVRSRIVVTDKNKIKEILTKRDLGIATELSCGYSCKLIQENGIHEKDGYYTYAQKDIIYNHVGLCDEGTGRAGRNVRILDTNEYKLDTKNFHSCRLEDPGQYTEWAYESEAEKSGGKQIDFVYGIRIKPERKSELQAIRYPKKIWSANEAKSHCNKHNGSFKTATGKNDKMEDSFKMPKFTRKQIKTAMFNMDAIDSTVNEDSVAIVNTLNTKLDEAIDVIIALEKKNDELHGNVDQMKETIDTQKNDIAELSNPNSDRVIAMINTREDVSNVANKLGVKVDGKDIKAIKVDCIKVVSENFDGTDKSEDHINGRFEMIREGLVNNDKAEGNEKLGEFVIKANDMGNKPVNHRENFIQKTKDIIKN